MYQWKFLVPRSFKYMRSLNLLMTQSFLSASLIRNVTLYLLAALSDQLDKYDLVRSCVQSSALLPTHSYSVAIRQARIAVGLYHHPCTKFCGAEFAAMGTHGLSWKSWRTTTHQIRHSAPSRQHALKAACMEPPSLWIKIRCMAKRPESIICMTLHHGPRDGLWSGMPPAQTHSQHCTEVRLATVWPLMLKWESLQKINTPHLVPTHACHIFQPVAIET